MNKQNPSQNLAARLRAHFFLALFLLVGLMLAGVHPVLAQPALGIVPTNNQVILFWPSSTHGTNGVLQSATNLVSPNWLSATDAFPVNYGSRMAVSVTNVPSARFFRLSLVPPTADGMALIQAGAFTMGDTLDGESDAIPKNVYVSAFYMDTNLVSSNQWGAVYAYATNNGYSFDDAGAGKGTNYPVETVDWYDCVKWCNARAQQAGLTPVYYTNAALTAVYTNGDVDAVYVNWSANGYRLPTEAEWEKAARGGLSGQRFPWGDTISESQANYYGDTNDVSYDLGPNGYNTNFDNGAYPYTSPVGSFPANGYGLNDMAGNLYEWCWDWYGTPYGQPTATNPTGPTTGSYRVLRGGFWVVTAYNARCADRDDDYPDGDGINRNGFRCVRGLPNTPTAPVLTGNRDLDMYNAAVADGTANGGVPGVMVTEDGGPIRVTAVGTYSYDVCLRYYPWSKLAVIEGTTSCSSTILPKGPAIEFGTGLACGGQDFYGY